MFILIIAVLVAMGVSFLCSIMEAALLSLNPGKLAVITKKHPVIGKICKEFRNHIERPIAVILILNTTAHTFGAAIAGAQFHTLYGNEYIWVFSLVFTLLMVQYTEILPKTLGVRFNSFVVMNTAIVLKFSIFLFSPLIYLVHLVNRPFERKGTTDTSTSVIAIEELTALASLAREADQLSVTQEQAIHQIPALNDAKVEDLMIPIEKMIYLSTCMTRQEVMTIIRINSFSRYPVRHHEDNHFMGCLEVRDMLFCEDKSWQTVVKPISFIQSEAVQLLLAENVLTLDSKLLLVKNNEKETIGMVTINDLLRKVFAKAPIENKSFN